MTTIVIDKDWERNQKIDQADFDDHKVVYVTEYRDININISNSIGSEIPLNFNLHAAELAGPITADVALGKDAHIQVDAVADFWSPLGQPTMNYKLGENSTLEILNGAYNSSTAIVNIDMGWSSSAKLIFNNEAFPNNGTIRLQPTITNLSYGDQISVTGATQGAYEDGDLLFRNDDGEVLGRFHAEGLVDDYLQFNGGSVTYYSCFLRGTHIATPDGEAKVEDLKAGDAVLTASGGIATVKWLGYRTLYKSRIPKKDFKRAFPILFRKDCIADNVPHRDLILSPGHHVSFDGNLVSAMNLVNGKSIVQLFEMFSFQYFHVELEQFDILLAEGVPAESYVDTGNRSMFQNAREVAMNPDFGPATGRPDVPGITVVKNGPVLDVIRAKLLERANCIRVPEAQRRAG